jgi:sensor histidine kinase regulating citrate/malate metabolism
VLAVMEAMSKNYERLPHDFNIESYQLNIIIGNLLENAIEAAGRSEEKRLSLYVSTQRGMLFINLSNSYNGTLRKNKGRFLSVKPDKRAHGLGLQNVKRMVREMNGEMLIEHDENDFSVKIMLYI